MGLLNISKLGHPDEKVYLLFHIHDETKAIEFHIIICRIPDDSIIYRLELSKEDLFVKKWAQNLNLNPDGYLEQLENSLLKKSLQTNAENSQETCFELDGENLIWKQYFSDKKIFGRKGRFTLEKVRNENPLVLIFENITLDFKRQNDKIENLTKLNEALIIEKDKLGEISEKAVLLKENLENKLYQKFYLLLNEKKKKINELSQRLIDVGVEPANTKSVEGQSTVTKNFDESISSPYDSDREINAATKEPLSDSEYDENTDVDSHSSDTEHLEATGIKRKNRASTSKMRHFSELKKSKILDSPDFGNNSLEMELM